MCNTTPRCAVSLVSALILSVMSVGAVEGEPPSRRYARTRSGERPKPIVVADNACAWPNLTVLGDGTIVATVFNAPYHAQIVGDVDWTDDDVALIGSHNAASMLNLNEGAT